MSLIMDPFSYLQQRLQPLADSMFMSKVILYFGYVCVRVWVYTYIHIICAYEESQSSP